jgi:hypothetical protein
MAEGRRRIRIDEKGLPVSREEAVAEEAGASLEDLDCACPRLDAEDWDRVENDWSDIAFARATTNAVLGVPIGYDGVRAELREIASKAGGTVPDDPMLLVGSGRFRRPILLEVEDPEDAAKDIYRPGGIAFTRLLQAPWGQLPKLTKATQAEAKERYGRDPDNTWVWYLTCRECSRARNFETLIVAHYTSAT